MHVWRFDVGTGEILSHSQKDNNGEKVKNIIAVGGSASRRGHSSDEAGEQRHANVDGVSERWSRWRGIRPPRAWQRRGILHNRS